MKQSVRNNYYALQFHFRTNTWLLSATSFCRTRQINPKGCGLLQALTMCTTKYYNTLRLARVKIPSPRKHFIISWVYKPKVPNTNLLEPRKQWSMKIFILKQNTREPDH